MQIYKSLKKISIRMIISLAGEKFSGMKYLLYFIRGEKRINYYQKIIIQQDNSNFFFFNIAFIPLLRIIIKDLTVAILSIFFSFFLFFFLSYYTINLRLLLVNLESQNKFPLPRKVKFKFF